MAELRKEGISGLFPLLSIIMERNQDVREWDILIILVD
jgi:hypothetical protein